jgi:hypothetical protein
VGQTALRSGEYANSKVRIRTQSPGRNTAFVFQAAGKNGGRIVMPQLNVQEQEQKTISPRLRKQVGILMAVRSTLRSNEVESFSPLALALSQSQSSASADASTPK